MKIFFSTVNCKAGKPPAYINQPAETLESTAKKLISEGKLSANTFINPKIDEVFNALKSEGFSREAFVKADAKFRSLAVSRAETVVEKLNNITSRFQKENLTRHDLIKAALKNPSIFLYSPPTLEYNIKEAAKRFSSYGINTELYLKTALRLPVLFSMSPDTVENTFKKLSNYTGKNGISSELTMKMVVNNPNLLTARTEHIEKNIKTIAQALKENGVTEKAVLEAATKQPTVLNYLPEVFIEKFNLLKYIENIKFADTGKKKPATEEIGTKILSKNLTNSLEQNYLILLRNKLAAKYKIRISHRGLKKHLEDFIKSHAGNTFEFEIPKGKFARTFIEYIQNFSEKLAGKNIFNIKILKKV